MTRKSSVHVEVEMKCNRLRPAFIWNRGLRTWSSLSSTHRHFMQAKGRSCFSYILKPEIQQFSPKYTKVAQKLHARLSCTQFKNRHSKTPIS
jgi:hypothetical protein